ncbi:hypothetical protein L1049_002179 [Liquidambar formosana]|uniref:TOG domain-containing protein n=1 Tax=Liquidambar formosana TaxID=63359 RepID=A0AAP0R829_LIQFO
MIETCFPDLLPEYLASPEWQKRHAAVIALAVIAEECSKALKQNLGQLVGTVLKFIRDPHPRVRWAATNAIMEFSKYLGPELQDQHHQQLLPALITAMDDFQNPRVQVHSASAMLFFSKQCTPKTLTPYLNVIVSKLLKCLQKGKRMLKEESLAALASVASSSQEHFQAYYDTVMPYLKVIMMSSTDKYNRMLLGKSIECITMVGMAVGKEKFINDVQLVVQVLMSSQESRMETDDPIKNFALQAWGRFCKCLGQEFVPYMGVAMPCLIQSAKLKTHVTSLSSSSVDSDDLDNESTKSKTLGSESIEIKNHVLEEKAVACNVLCCCAAELEERLHLWIDEVAHSLVPLLKFNLHEEVKMAAVSAMPLILHSAKSAVEKRLLQGFNESPVKKLSAEIIPALVDALRKEAETEICARILDSLNECIQVGDCLSTLIKTYKAPLLPFFDKLLSCMALMWGNNKTVKERRIAFRIFYDVSKECREEAFRYYEPSLPILFKVCIDKNPEVRQIAACGIGVCAEFGGSVFKPLVRVALSSICSVLKHPKALHPDNVTASDAAVSAFGKICWFHRDNFNAAEVVPAWLSHLPIKNDLNEAKIVHDQLCSMVEMSDKELLGPENINLPKIFAVFAEVLWAGNNLATVQTCNRIIKQLKHFQRILPPTTLASILSSLQSPQRNLLQSLLSP